MRKFLVFLSLVVVLSFGTAFAQNGDVVVSLDNITNTVLGSGGTELKAGNTHVIDIRYDCSGTVTGMLWATSNAWELYSPELADWVGMQAAKGPLTLATLDAGVSQFLKHYTWNGSAWIVTGGTPSGSIPAPGYNAATAQKVGFYFASVSSEGTNGYDGGIDNGIALTVTFQTLVADAGKTICFDTSRIQSWEWSFGSDVPDNVFWDNGLGVSGERCWDIMLPSYNDPGFCAVGGGTPATPADQDLDANYSFNHCDVGTFTLCGGDFWEIDPANVEPVSFAFAPGFETGFGSVTAAGVWTWSGAGVPQSGFADPEFVVFDAHGQQTEHFTLHVEVTNEAPTVTCAVGGVTVGKGTTKVQGITFGDTDDCDVAGLIVTVPHWTDSVADDFVDVTGNVVSFTPGASRAAASTVTMTVQVSDGALTDECVLIWNVITGSPYQVEITKDSMTYQGSYNSIDLVLHTADPTDGIGGFDFLIAYDASALSFQSATEGDIYTACLWEYFTYRFGPDGVCGSGCPSGMLAVTGMAESNNGPYHPICNAGHNGYVEQDDLPITLATLKFLVSNDRTLECQYVPVRFYWMECADNVISNFDGSKLYLTEKLFDFAVYNDPFVEGEITGTYAFPTYGGTFATLTAEDCYFNDEEHSKFALPGIGFQNGGFDIACADSIDARGDINLNGLAYEIADAVMFTNYFVNGPLTAFGTHYEGSVAASDCNADGLSLTVADLVYLIRVVIGDAQAIPKTTPQAAKLNVNGDTYSLNAAAGAGFLVFEGTVTPQLLAENMQMKFAVVNGNTNVLIYRDDVAGQTFSGDFVRANGRLISSEFATYEGAVLKTGDALPTSFSVYQNYPNPFNPTTDISFDMPTAGAFTVDIYNAIGQKVKTIAGTSNGGTETVTWDASNVASGIYFYKVTAGDQSKTMKAVLLK